MRIPPLVRVIASGLVACCAVILGAACAGPSPNAVLARATPARSLALELRDTSFDLARLEVTANEVVDLTLANRGALDHDFTIDKMPGAALVLGAQTAEHQEHAQQAAVHGAPGPGKSVTLRLQPATAGEYTYYCSITGHREAGMAGTLTVVPGAGG